MDALYRCKEHTNLLVDDIDLGVLWDEYGIVGDLVVCLLEYAIRTWRY